MANPSGLTRKLVSLVMMRQGGADVIDDLFAKLVSWFSPLISDHDVARCD